MTCAGEYISTGSADPDHTKLCVLSESSGLVRAVSEAGDPSYHEQNDQPVCGRQAEGIKERPMAKGYWIVRVDIADQERYKEYVAANAEPFKKYGARFLARAGRFENPEGSSRARNAVIEFQTYQAALDCWNSPEYQAAIKLRQSVSTIDLVIIEGYDGPQPS